MQSVDKGMELQGPSLAPCVNGVGAVCGSTTAWYGHEASEVAASRRPSSLGTDKNEGSPFSCSRYEHILRSIWVTSWSASSALTDVSAWLVALSSVESTVGEPGLYLRHAGTELEGRGVMA